MNGALRGVADGAGSALMHMVFLTAAAQVAISGTEPPRIVMEEFMIPAADSGIALYVRNKHPRGIQTFSGDKILLFVHGGTYPAEATFDLSLGGISWMEFIAQHGYDVYLVDVRGYGKSTRPSEMNQPADQNRPIVPTETAVKDVGAVVDFILSRRRVSQINLMGWSWGTAITGWYTAQNNEKVHKLVLYAGGWVRNGPSPADSGGTLGAYRSVTMDVAKKRWLTGTPEHKKPDLIPSGWFETFWTAVLASDTVGSTQNPPVLRAPNGSVQDSRDYWSVGKPLYDPRQIKVPTFLAHAEWDQDVTSDMLHAYFARLTNVPYKRYVEIGEGTHFILMERNRMQLFRAIQQFLDERFRPEA